MEYVTGRAEVKDGGMDYLRFGKAGAQPVVIIPGLSLGSVMPLAAAVAEAYAPLGDVFDVYLFDRKDPVREGYDIASMAADTMEAVRVCGIRKAVLIGVSQGGMIAQMMAAEYPEEISAMLLVSTALRISPDARGVLSGWTDLARRRDPEGLVMAFGEAVYTRAVFEGSREILRQAAAAATEEDLARFLIFSEAAADFDMSRESGKVTCPVSVIAGTDDRIFGRADKKELADAYGADVIWFDGFGHALYDEAPDYKERARDEIKRILIQ